MSEPRGLDFFISYTQADRDWAEWIAWQLVEAGYTATIQAWDFQPGFSFVTEMHKAASTADRTIAVLSPDYLDSRFPQAEWGAAFVTDPKGEKGTLLPVRVRECKPGGLLSQIIYVDLVGLSEQTAREKLLAAARPGRPKPTTPPIFPGSLKPAYPGHAKTPAVLPEVSISRLPSTGRDLFGRDEELRWLEEAWNTPGVHVLILVAGGGVGKSALVNHWLSQLAMENYRGAARVFGWSFYSQGTGEREASADLFVSEALQWFGDPDPAAGSPWGKGERLARLVRRQPTLLVLDGLEPLQSPPPFDSRLKDQTLAALLRELAGQNPGLCVITTRLPVADLQKFTGGTVQQHELQHLSPRAGAEVLRAQGVRGTLQELEKAAEQFGGHSLALTLLGSYLHDRYNGKVRYRSEIGPLEADERQGGHARRVMESYERWFGEGPERGVLHLLGLFNRPADREAVEALRAEPAIQGLTEPLQNLAESDWNAALARLRRARLLADVDASKPGTLDAHPLIREHFGEKLKIKNPMAWREAHGRLYQYYKETSQEYPETLESTIPLYAAVTHGCEAGLHQKALHEVWQARIMKAEKFFTITQKLGADLGALAGFFNPPWSKPVAELSLEDRGYVLNQAGFRLRAMGRLEEAVKPMEDAFEVDLSLGNLKQAAINANHLSEFYLPLGKIPLALDYAEQGLKLADRSDSAFMRMVTRTTLSEVLHYAGRLDEAEAFFQAAEAIQREREPENPLVYAVWGSRYCDLLLSRRDWQKVQERVEQTLKVVESLNWHSDIGLDHLSLGRAYLLRAKELTTDFTQAEGHLNRAVDYLRYAGTQHHLPRGLLARAELYCLTHELSHARADLDEALSIAARGGMELFEADCHVGFARLYFALGDREEACCRLALAQQMIQKMGYHRQDEQVAGLERLCPTTSPSAPAR